MYGAWRKKNFFPSISVLIFVRGMKFFPIATLKPINRLGNVYRFRGGGGVVRGVFRGRDGLGGIASDKTNVQEGGRGGG